jgi:chaperone required for assembly of F1-ATPase
MHQPQPTLTINRLANAVSDHAPFQLAALNPLVTISGSLIIGLAVVEQEIPAEAAFDIAHLDELWQAEQWGEDYFALETRAAHRNDFLAAASFSTLLE